MSVYANNNLNKNSPNDAWFKVFSFIKPNTRILDIGCSSGRLGAALKNEKNVHVIGLDIDAGDIELAKQNLDEAYIANIEKDDLTQFGTFDYVVMADVIEHLLDPVAALKQVKKVLGASGKLVFSIPNMANATTRMELLKGKFTYKDFGLLDRTHLHFYDYEEVDRIFTEAGYTVTKTDNTIRIYPEQLLKKELASIGIELSPKLQRHFEDTYASVYQFIGIANPESSKKRMPTTTTSHLDVIAEEMEELRKSYEGALERSNDERLEEAQREIGKLHEELDRIYSSHGWRILTFIYTLAAKFQPQKNKNK